MSNTVQKFLLNDLSIRGALVSLDTEWQTVLERRSYPQKITQILGEATAATLLMSTNIKYEGQLMLQLQSAGELSLLVVQNDNQYRFRATASYEVDGMKELQSLTKNGLIAIMVEAEKGKEPYQGIIGIDSNSLADNIELYFNQSEQLQTLLVLRAHEKGIAGILLQVMPGSTLNEDDWWRLRHMSETLNLDELNETDSETMIARIFAEDDKTIYPAEPAHFKCSCSAEKTLAMLGNLGQKELQEIVDSNESINIGCDFCGKNFTHDAATISALLAHQAHPH